MSKQQTHSMPISFPSELSALSTGVLSSSSQKQPLDCVFRSLCARVGDVMPMKEVREDMTFVSWVSLRIIAI